MKLTVTDGAIRHFQGLIAKEDVEGMNLRIFVINPGTPAADIGVTFCPPKEEEKTDLKISFPNFSLFIDKISEDALLDAILDYEDDALGGQLSIKAPHLKGKKPGKESPLSEQIQYTLDAEVNPNLASHGGKVSLVEILEGGIVVLRFGGGCHGCGMVNVTLKEGIEKTLKEKFKEVTEVRDITDHALGENPYY
jgi:Fe/S biogenesis protein NfuA